MTPRHPATVSPWILVATFALLAAGIGAGGYVFYRQQRAQILEHERRELDAVASLKVQQLAAWRREREADLDSVPANPPLAAAVAELLADPTGQRHAADLRRWLEAIRDADQLHAAYLIDASGAVRLAVGDARKSLTSHGRAAALEAVRSGRPVMTNLEWDADVGRAHLDLAAPFARPEGADTIGAVVECVDPAPYFYPMVQAWPTPSPSAETLLVRRVGDDVLFVNELRHRKGTAFRLRHPVKDAWLPAAMAVRGQVGVVDGVDYRGVPVLAAVRPVPGSPWFVVAKIDRAEVTAPLRERARIVLFLVLALVAAAGGGVLLVWRQQQARFFRREYEAQRERQVLLRRYEQVMRHARDVIILTSPDGRIVEANERAIAVYGYDRTALLELRVQDLRAPETVADLPVQWQAADSAGGTTFETRHRRKSGETFPVEVSLQALEIEGQQLRLGVVRDISERERARAALRASEARLAATLNSIGDAVVATDAAGRVTLMNPVAEELSGWRVEDARARPLAEVLRLINEETRAPVEDPATRVLREGMVVGLANHTILVARDGRERPVADSGAPIRGADAALVGVVVVFRDQTEERAREAALRESERRLRDVFETVQLLAVTLDGEGRVTFCNDYLCGLLGWTRAELVGRDWFETCVPPEARAEVRAVFGSLLASGGLPAHVRNEIVTRAGARRVIDWNNTIVRSPAGAPAGTASLGEDVTERLQIETALRASDERNRILASQAPVGIFQLDREGSLVFANDRWLEMLGLTATQAAGRGWLATVPPEERGPMLERARAALAAGSSFEMEHRFVRPNGEVVWVLGHAASLRDESGAVVGVLGFNNDVTDRRAMQARLLQADRLVSVGTLAAGVAHEINNPLAYVVANLGYAVDELRGAPSDSVPVGEVLEALTEAQEGADRVRRIVRDLKVFSRADEERLAMVSVEKVLDSSISMAMNEIKHRAQLVRDYAGVPAVRANDARLGQVFLNLLVNAAQAIPEGRADRNRITVRTLVDGAGRVAVEVTDTGSGIPPETLRRIFDPFFTTKPVGEGTGLGLAICQSVVTALGGEVQVESTVGTGSTFRVLLPVGPAVPAEEPSAAPVAAARRGRVLVIDDEELVTRAIQRMLAEHHEVVAETEPRRALARLAAGERFDAIVCDLMMPERTGMDVHEEVARRWPDLAGRIVFLTGGAFTAHAREFVERVPNRCLEKPVDARSLTEAVAALLE